MDNSQFVKVHPAPGMHARYVSVGSIESIEMHTEGEEIKVILHTSTGSHQADDGASIARELNDPWGRG